MNILFLTHNGHPYGANKSLYSVLKKLAIDHQVLLLTPFKNSFVEEETDFENCSLPFFPSIFFYKRKWKYFAYPFLMCLNVLIFPYLLYLVKKFQPEIIYSNSSVENMGKILSFFVKSKHICHVREFGDLDYDFKCVFGKNFKKKYLNSSDGLIFNSNIVQETVMPQEDRNTLCVTIYNGIDSKGYEYNEIKKQVDSFKVGVVGYIHPGKRQLEAVQYMTPILKCHSSISLHIFGSGESEYIKEIKDYIDMLGLTRRVFFDGFIKDTDSIYAGLNASLVFSENEAFGRVTIESMLRGVPVIAYNGGGSVEIIEDLHDGLLFRTNSEFEQIFDKLYTDTSFLESIRKNGVEKIKTKFSEEQYIKQVEMFISKIYES